MEKLFLILMFVALFLANACQVNRVQAGANYVPTEVNKTKIKVKKIKPNTEKFRVEKLSEKGQTAFQSLLEAERFEEGYIGEAGILSRYVKDFNVLLQEKSADEAFKALLNEATLAGELYGLCGVYFTDYDFFKKTVEIYKKSDESVETMSGCEIFSEKVSKIIVSDSPNVAIINPSQTIEDWRTKNKSSYYLDIAHGGYPATFKSLANSVKAEK